MKAKAKLHGQRLMHRWAYTWHHLAIPGRVKVSLRLPKYPSSISLCCRLKSMHLFQHHMSPTKSLEWGKALTEIQTGRASGSPAHY